MEGHRARRRFSQNFLHDAGYLKRIVDAIDPKPGQDVVEIGPGLGALTAPLIERTGRIRAIEIDRDLAARLRERFGPDRLDLVEGDALAVDWPGFAATHPEKLRIVGNLPYHVSTPLLFALLPIADRVIDQHFMLQREVVERMAAKPGGAEYGRLSVMLQFRYDVKQLFNVPPGAFSPPPKVTSSIVRMTPLPREQLASVPPEAFGEVVTAAFSQRRKTLRNALGRLLTEEQIERAGIDPGARAQTLGVEAFCALTKQMLLAQ
jgi:16S rRNA (adenine1518-N6/adenine1519-N6)-dimethyltransferase